MNKHVVGQGADYQIETVVRMTLEGDSSKQATCDRAWESFEAHPNVKEVIGVMVDMQFYAAGLLQECRELKAQVKRLETLRQQAESAVG